MLSSILAGALTLSTLIRGVVAEHNPKENFVLADCGIGDVPGHPDWSSSQYVLYYDGAVCQYLSHPALPREQDTDLT